jgi:hypothetical protein
MASVLASRCSRRAEHPPPARESIQPVDLLGAGESILSGSPRSWLMRPVPRHYAPILTGRFTVR